MDTTTDSARAPEVIAPGHGHHLHFLNHLATIRVSAGEHGSMSVVEFEAPRGFGPPLHRHDTEDELFILLDGELELRRGDERFTATAGDIALLPHGHPHTFQVLSTTARFTCVTSTRTGAPRFDRMVAELGEPVDVPSLPEPGYLDATRIANVCRRYGIEVLGPPPAPLP
jgi:quercetin dioxygenase-like cupin family protein